MRQRSLLERMERGNREAEPHRMLRQGKASDAPAVDGSRPVLEVSPAVAEIAVLETIAAALAEVTKPKPRPSLSMASKSAAQNSKADAPVIEALPLVLTAPSSRQTSLVAVSSPERPQFLAPALLIGSLLAVGLLMSAALTRDLKPKLSRGDNAAIALLEARLMLPEARPVADASADSDLLDACERLIANGNVGKARGILQDAVATGSPIARFALAETFDPNVLAAWGLRDAVADAEIARALYAEALRHGDVRASARISALTSAD